MQAGPDGPNMDKFLILDCVIFKAFVGVNISQVLNCLYSIYKFSTVCRKRFAFICFIIISLSKEVFWVLTEFLLGEEVDEKSCKATFP